MRVSFRNKKGKKLVGILSTPKNKTRKAIIFLHGLNGDKSYYSFFIRTTQTLVSNGYAVLRFDFNTHGESDNDWKNFTRKTCAKDLDAAIIFLKNKGFDTFGVFATSMGCEAFVLRSKLVRAAVLFNPFLLHSLWRGWILPYAAENRRRGYVRLIQRRTGEELRYGLALQRESLTAYPERDVKNVTCPTLIMFGSQDSQTTPIDRKRMYDHFTCEKSFYLVKGAKHSHTTATQDVVIAKKSLAWFKKYLDKTRAEQIP